jgi:putative sugar O-methyltransferase
VFSTYSIISILEEFPQFKSDSFIILDIGSGWGRIGYLFQLINPKCSYIALDIPASLAVAQNYLPSILRNRNHKYYSESRTRTNFNRDYFYTNPGVHYLLSQQLALFSEESVDLAINIASFQEMSIPQVKAYLELMSSVASQGIYLLQRKKGDEVAQEDYVLKNPWVQKISRDMPLLSGYFESIFRKIRR